MQLFGKIKKFTIRYNQTVNNLKKTNSVVMKEIVWLVINVIRLDAKRTYQEINRKTIGNP
jgi:hypothetical protein